MSNEPSAMNSASPVKFVAYLTGEPVNAYGKYND